MLACSNATLDLRKRFSYVIWMAMAIAARWVHQAPIDTRCYMMLNQKPEFLNYIFNDRVMLFEHSNKIASTARFMRHRNAFRLCGVFGVKIHSNPLSERSPKKRPIIQFSHLKCILVTLMQQTTMQLCSYSQYFFKI